MKVSDFMIRDVIKGKPENSIKEIMCLLVDKKIGGMPICDEDGKLVGMISDGDILRAIQPVDPQIFHYMVYMFFDEGQDLKSRIGNLAETQIINIARTRGLISVCEDDDMEKAVSLLAKHHFKKIPVLDQHKHVVGVISRGDVIRKIQTTLLNKN